MAENDKNKIWEDISDFERSLIEGDEIRKISRRADLIINDLESSDFRELGITEDLRSRLDMVANNSVLKGEGFYDVREKILKAKSLTEEVIPSLSDLAKKYEYEGLEAVEREDLKIDWFSLGVPNLYTALDKFDEYDEHSKGAVRNDERGFTLIPIFNKSFDRYGNMDAGDFEFKANILETDEKKYGGDKNLQMEVIYPETDGNNRYVCDFDYVYQGEKNGVEEWVNSHRQVNERYRGQKIGKMMFYFMEEFLRRRAELKGKKQVLSFNVGTCFAILTLLKYGYKPATLEDQKRLDEILNADEKLIMQHCPKDEEDFQRSISRPQFYIFEKDKYYLEDGKTPNPKVWDYQSYGEEEFYMQSSYKVKLIKEF